MCRQMRSGGAVVTVRLKGAKKRHQTKPKTALAGGWV